jgi:glucose dehydrogenase
VQSLTPAWAASTLIDDPARSENRPAQSTPLVVDGVMYVTDFPGNVWAFSAATGQPLFLVSRAQLRAQPGQRCFPHARGTRFV